MQTGQITGYYKILRPLGKGGIGEVYLADGTKFKREVAIKVLPERLHQNAERLASIRARASTIGRSGFSLTKGV